VKKQLKTIKTMIKTIKIKKIIITNAKKIRKNQNYNVITTTEPNILFIWLHTAEITSKKTKNCNNISQEHGMVLSCMHSAEITPKNKTVTTSQEQELVFIWRHTVARIP